MNWTELNKVMTIFMLPNRDDLTSFGFKTSPSNIGNKNSQINKEAIKDAINRPLFHFISVNHPGSLARQPADHLGHLCMQLAMFYTLIALDCLSFIWPSLPVKARQQTWWTCTHFHTPSLLRSQIAALHLICINVYIYTHTLVLVLVEFVHHDCHSQKFFLT